MGKPPPRDDAKRFRNVIPHRQNRLNRIRSSFTHGDSNLSEQLSGAINLGFRKGRAVEQQKWFWLRWRYPATIERAADEASDNTRAAIDEMRAKKYSSRDTFRTPANELIPSQQRWSTD